MENAEEDYAREIAEFFIGLRGSGLFLSPADSALILEWEEAGIPLSVVLAGIHRGAVRLLKRRRSLRSLRSVRRDVLAEVRRRRTSLPKSSREPSSTSSEGRTVASSPSFEYDRVRASLRAHIEKLEAFAADPKGGFSLPDLSEKLEIPSPLIQDTLRALTAMLDGDDFGPAGPVALLLELGRVFYERLWASLEPTIRSHLEKELRRSLGERLRSMSAEAQDETLWELERRMLREALALFDPVELFDLWTPP